MKWKPLIVVLAIVFQVGVVATMAISREWILANGSPFTFQTAPVDPRDIFRGDYVRLDYLFSTLPASQLDETINKEGLHKGQKVYLSLRVDGSGIAHGERLYASPPVDIPYIQGRTLQHWPWQGYRRLSEEQKARRHVGPVSLKFGIEQFYVEQGSGRAIEEMRGNRNDFQLPMLIHARVSGSGEAVIHNYDWANIAVKTDMASTPERDAPDEQASVVVRMILKNPASQAITLPLRSGNCSFTLVGTRWAPAEATAFSGQRSECDNANIEPVTLGPGEEHAITFDLNRPIWRVQLNNKLTPPGRLPWSYRYRIVYQGEALNDVKGVIMSRAFHARGNID